MHAVAFSVENLIQMLNNGLAADDPTAVAALAEWLVLTAGIAGMAHVMSHLDPRVLAQATEDAANCDKGDEPTNLH